MNAMKIFFPLLMVIAGLVAEVVGGCGAQTVASLLVCLA